MADDANNIGLDVLQAPADLSDQLEQVTNLTDENTSRIWDLEGDMKGAFGVEAWIAQLREELKKVKERVEQNVPEEGDNAVEATDVDQDENLDGGSIPDSEIDSPLSYTLDWNEDSEDELVLYNVFTDNNGFTVDGATDNNSWLSGLGFGMVDKSDTSTLKWTTFDGNLDYGGDDSESAHDGRYWRLGGNYNDDLGAGACYGKSIAESNGTDLRIHIDDYKLYRGTEATSYQATVEWNSCYLNDQAEVLTLDWNSRQLDGADWTVLAGTILKVADTTAAASGDGALEVTGGGYFGNGIYSVGDVITPAGYFINSTCTAEVAVTSTLALRARGDISIQTTGDYYHLGNQGGTGDDASYVSGGLVLAKAGKTLTIIDGNDLKATDKLVVWR